MRGFWGSIDLSDSLRGKQVSSRETTLIVQNGETGNVYVASKKYTGMLSCLIYWGRNANVVDKPSYMYLHFFSSVISIPEYHVYLTISHSQVTFKEVSLILW